MQSRGPDLQIARQIHLRFRDQKSILGLITLGDNGFE
jgi:hypothetical protein